MVEAVYVISEKMAAVGTEEQIYTCYTKAKAEELIEHIIDTDWPAPSLTIKRDYAGTRALSAEVWREDVLVAVVTAQQIPLMD